MTYLVRTAVTVVVLGVLLLAAACSRPWGHGEQSVLLSDIEFVPNRIQVAKGDVIHFTNQDAFDHNVYLVRTANPNDVLIGPETIPSGETIDVTVDVDGLFTLYCTIHGGMTGMVSSTGSFELTAEEKAKAASMHVVPAIAKTGEELFWGRAQCHQCHRLGDRGDGLRGPDLNNIGFRSASRAETFGLDNGTEYIVQSIMEPHAHIVEGYTDDMAIVYQTPINLTEEDLEAIVSYLQSQGGEVDTWLIDIPRKILESAPPENPYRNGDPIRGKDVFEKMRCYSCHRVGDRKAISVGPELTEIGAFRNWSWLAESVIDPNAEIGVNWKQATVRLKSGGSASGSLRRRTPSEVELEVGPQDLQTFPASDIEEVKIQETTRMPANYEELMTPAELADLIRYLQSLEGGDGAAESPASTSGSAQVR